MNSADICGLQALCNIVESGSFTNIVILPEGARGNSAPIFATEAGQPAALLQQIRHFAKTINPANFNVYEVKLSNGVNVSKFSFCFQNTPAAAMYGTPQPQNSQQDIDTIIESRVKQRLQEHEQLSLQAQINDITSDIEDIFDRLEEIEAKPESSQHADLLKLFLQMNNKTAAPAAPTASALAGLPQTLENIVLSLQKHDAEIEKHLQKLLTIAETNAPLFELLLNQLDNV